MDLPFIERGMRILADHINKLASEIRSNAITAVTGGKFQRTASGTSIQLDPGFFGGGGGGGITTPCAFKITDATEGETVQVRIAFGIINGRVPDGMVFGTPYLLPVTESGFIYAVVVFNTTTLEVADGATSVTLTFETSPQANTTDTVFVLLGTVSFESGAITAVYSVCDQPYANPCALSLEPAPEPAP